MYRFFYALNLLLAVTLAGVGVWYFTLDNRLSGSFLIAAAVTLAIVAIMQLRGIHK